MPAQFEKSVRFNLPESPRNDFPVEYDETVSYLQLLFKQKSMGLDEMFYGVLDAIQSENDKLSQKQLFYLVKSLSLFVTSIDHKVQPLINAILSIQWLDQDQQFIAAYMHLLQNLVSAQSSCIIPICKMLIQNIINGPQRYPHIPDLVLFELIHTAISKVLRLIPSGPACIVPLLSSMLPHKTESISVISFYIKSLLYIADYATVIQSDIITLIVELIVQIDIDIQVEDLEEEVEGNDIFTMDDVKATTTAAEEDSDSDSVLRISSDYKLMLAKLDIIMSQMMEYVKRLHQSSTDSNDTTQLYDFYYALLDAFDKIMLPTHKLRCAQFLLFYVCSCVPDTFPEDFMGLLVTHLISQTESNVIRMSSAAYLGSLIARAKYIDIASVRHCLKIMNQVCVDYVEANEGQLSGQLSLARHQVLYGTIQSILYIFCFRWKEIMIVDDRPQTGSFPAELVGFQRVLLSKFAPLRVILINKACSEVIVDEFARITHNLNIMYCYPLMQSTLRSGESGAELVSLQRLEAYFPFDPLVLPKTKTFIESLYNEWEDEHSEFEVSGSELNSSIQGMSLDEKLSMSMSMSISLG